MTVFFNAGDAVGALNKIKGASGSARNTISILDCVRVTPGHGSVEFAATNLDLHAEARIGAGNPTGDPAACLPLKELRAWLAALPKDAAIALETMTGTRATLRSGRTTCTLTPIPATDWPEWKAEPATHAFTLPATTLKALLDKTAFAMSNEATCYYLNGVFLHFYQGGGHDTLRAVATDGRRLSCSEIPAPSGSARMPGVIIPSATVLLMQKLLAKAKGDATLALSGTGIRLDAEGCTLHSKLVDGTFPDYMRVVPQAFNKTLTVDVAALAKAAKQLRAQSQDRDAVLRMALSKDALHIAVKSDGQDAGSTTVDALYDGDALTVGLNAKRILDALSAFGKTDTVLFQFSDAVSPVMVRSRIGSADWQLLMPVRV